MKKVLVTGAAGFIGMHLIELLTKKGFDVVGLDVINDYYDVDLKKNRLQHLGVQKSAIDYGKKIPGKEGFSFIQLLLEDKEKVLELFKAEKFDYVVNLAAQAGVRYSLDHPQTYVDTNVTGFLSLLEAARAYPVKHFLFASSSSVYGMNKKIPFKESDPTEHPLSLYAATKKSNEMLAHSYADLFKIPLTGLRFFSVYGTWGRPDVALFIFTKSIIEGKPIDVYNNGNMDRDFTYVSDIVEGVSRLFDVLPEPVENKPGLPADVSRAPFSVYNIGRGAPVSLMEFIYEIERNVGIKAEMNYMPMQLGDIEISYADTTKLENATGYQPTTNVKEGVKAFVDWYKDYFKIK